MGIDEKISFLNGKKPFPKYTQSSLEEDFKLKFIYYSNKIEGSTLSLMETKVILEGITVENHSLDEHVLVKKLERVYDYMVSTQKNEKTLNFKELCTLAEIENRGYIGKVCKLLEKVDFEDKLNWNEGLDLAIRIHNKLLVINGHLARLSINYILVGFGYLPVIIEEYDGNLESTIENSENKMIDFYLELVRS